MIFVSSQIQEQQAVYTRGLMKVIPSQGTSRSILSMHAKIDGDREGIDLRVDTKDSLLTTAIVEKLTPEKADVMVDFLTRPENRDQLLKLLDNVRVAINLKHLGGLLYILEKIEHNIDTVKLFEEEVTMGTVRVRNDLSPKLLRTVLAQKGKLEAAGNIEDRLKKIAADDNPIQVCEDVAKYLFPDDEDMEE